MDAYVYQISRFLSQEHTSFGNNPWQNVIAHQFDHSNLIDAVAPYWIVTISQR